MRRLLSFDCESHVLGASLDPADGPTAILFVTGGSQTRIGSHRMFERLAGALAKRGHACFRYDRRGVGDSEGEDPGYRGSGPDIEAAARALRRENPSVDRVIGFGLCDGASALALSGAGAGLHGLILVNPWLVEAEANAPPAAAIRQHYRQRLLSAEGWKKIINGTISYRKLFKGIAKIISPPPSDLAGQIANALGRSGLPAQLVLARGDATAIAAEAEWNSSVFRKIRERNPAPLYLDTDSHTFARPGDMEALLQACLAALTALLGRD